MGPRAQVGMSSSAQNIRGVPETHFWRECIHILPKVRFCTVDGQWTVQWTVKNCGFSTVDVKSEWQGYVGYLPTQIYSHC